MSLNKGFDLYFTIRLAFLICLRDEELWQKRTASTQCSNEARQSPQSHKEPGRKDTTQPMYAIVQNFADFVRTHSIYKAPSQKMAM